MHQIFNLTMLLIALLARTGAASNSYIYLPDKLIQEEISIGSLIVDVSEEIESYNQQHKQTDNLDAATGENQQYAFLDDQKTSTENTYFLLDSVTGRVMSKRYLDRESMCINKHCTNACDTEVRAYVLDPAKSDTNRSAVDKAIQQGAGDCNMNLKILVIPSYNIVTLNIVIQDINDNKPYFRVELMNEAVPENVPIGYKIPIDLAYDPDTGLNSIQYYSMIQAAPAGTLLSSFELIKQTFELVHDETKLLLVVKQKLDREIVAQYNLSISACDGGTPSNCGILKLILNVIDINDHNPVFLKEVYSFSVPENLTPHSVIGQLTAFDMDEGVNGKIKYSINGLAETNKSFLKYFELDADTGVLRLNRQLDFEEKQYFSLNVEAKDCGAGSSPAYATVEIAVIDVNDNPPEITVSFLNALHRNSTKSNTSLMHVYIKENYEPNKFIALASILDRDENAKLNWKVYMNGRLLDSTDKPDEQMLSISILNSNSFTINTGNKSDSLLDREKTPSINVSRSKN